MVTDDQTALKAVFSNKSPRHHVLVAIPLLSMADPVFEVNMMYSYVMSLLNACLER